MERRFFYTIVSTIFLASCGFSSLDITELSSFQYSIDIAGQPVLVDETTEKELIVLSSKHGQKYQCQYESFSQFSQKVREEEENASKQSVTGLLQPMEGNPCLIMTTGWWTYEFCYKKHIKQFHVSEQKVAGDVLYLGLYAGEFDWGVRHEKEVPEVRHRYHSQEYVNGSLCDLTGTMRSAEVRFKCKEDSLDSFVSVEEPSTCKYLLHVSTPHLCKHPSLRTVPEKTSLPIVCNPVLDDSDYKDYVEYQKRLAEERKNDESLQLESQKEVAKSNDMASDDMDLEGGGFGFIEIGNTRVKFYVLNYDGTAANGDKNFKSETISVESTTYKEEISPSSDTSPSESPSSSPSLESSSESSEVESLESETLDSGEDNKISEEMFGEDSQEFLAIYKRLLSNKKLKSFVKQSRLPKDETPEVVPSETEALVEAEADAAKTEEEDLSIEDEGLFVEDSQGAGDEVRTATETEDISTEDKEKEILRVYLEGLFASSKAEKDSRDPTEGAQGVDEYDIGDKESVSSPSSVEKETDGGASEAEAPGKDGEVPSTGAANAEADQKVAGELFKKGDVLLSEEHKNIHNMIMAIIKQSDRGAKEVSRHANMKKNYEFHWEKQKKLAKVQKKSKEEKDEL